MDLKERWLKVWLRAGARIDPLQLWPDFWSLNRKRWRQIKARLKKFNSPRVRRYSSAPVIELALWYSDPVTAHNDTLAILGAAGGMRFARHLANLVRAANREKRPDSPDEEVIAAITKPTK